MRMYKFNLQPWREQRREAQKKQFVAITSIVVALAVAAFAAERWYQKRIEQQQIVAIDLLKEDIARFNKTKTEVERLEALNTEVNKQISVIQELQQQRGLAVLILDYIASETPNNVFLTALAFENNQLTISGVAENDKGISEFMRAMSNFDYFGSPELQNIASATGNQAYSVREDSEVKAFEVIIPVKSFDSNLSNDQETEGTAQ